MNIVGYAYEADVHCVACTRRRFHAEPGNHGRLDHATDSEGNPVTPIFDIDENADDEHCGDCGEKLL